MDGSSLGLGKLLEVLPGIKAIVAGRAGRGPPLLAFSGPLNIKERVVTARCLKHDPNDVNLHRFGP